MRIAVLNRGEAAVRFIRAVREYNVERKTELEPIAFYTQPDDGAPFMRMADEAVYMGNAMVPGKDGAMVSAYCEHDSVLKLLKKHRCEAVWPGWGFISEDPAFVARLEDAGITFMGPGSDAMNRLGDKIASKQLAETFEVPVSPWTIIEDQSEKELKAEAKRIGYPLMVKASAGGGGRGIRKVDDESALLESIQSAQDEVKKIFAAGGLFMEACITGARHIEVQFLVDAEGRATALGIRDCSIQRRNQKVIEEAPSPVVDDAGKKEICNATVRLAEGSGYRGVGTAEYLYKPDKKEFYFLEVNSRLQVEHTLTEVTTGADLVKAQIDIARGLAWANPGTATHGYAIEARLNAENPEKGFQPSPGLVRVFEPPSGPGLRVDSGVAEGVAIAPEFDSMIAKVIAHGRTREEAIARLVRALKEFPVIVEDGATNKAFLLQLLQQKPYLDGTADTQWLDRAMEDDTFSGNRHAFEAALVSAIVVYQQTMTASSQQFMLETQNGIPQNLDAPEGANISLRLGNNNYDIQVYAFGKDRFMVGPEGAMHEVHFVGRHAHAAMLHISGKHYEVLYSRGSTGIYVEIDGAGHVIEEMSGGLVKAPSPAMVVSVSVEEGDTVQVGDRLATLEAMKMEMPLYAQEAGTVKAVLCRANQQVTAGQPLVELDTEGAEGEEASTGHAPVLVPEPRPIDALFEDGKAFINRLDEMKPKEAAAVVADLVKLIEPVLLGYDVPPEVTARLRAIFADDSAFSTLANPERLLPMAQTLGAFADTESLFDRNFLPLEDQTAAISAEIAFYEFCRKHHEGEDNAPTELKDALKQALDWFGVASLDPSDELRLALWRLAVGHGHSELRHRLCSSIMRALIALHSAGARFNSLKTLPDVLDRVAQLAHASFPFVTDNARQASYELFQRSHFVHRRKQVEAKLDKALKDLAGLTIGTAPYLEEIMSVVTTRHTLTRMIIGRTNPDRKSAPIAAEILCRRRYEEHGDITWSTNESDGILFASLALNHNEEIDHVLMACASTGDLNNALVALAAQAGEHKGKKIATEVVLFEEAGSLEFGEEVEKAISNSSLQKSGISRVTVTWGDESDILRHRTYWNTGDGKLQDTALLRDIHPESARRIELWRLSEFDVERLASHEHVYAFRGQAKKNPDDERLFVFAEVRDVPMQTAGANEAEHLLEFEHAYFEALRIIREAQARRPKRRRYQYNRLSFHLRPVFRLKAHELVAISHPLEASTRGLGLQKVVIRARVSDGNTPETLRDTEIVVSNPSRSKLQIHFREPHAHPIRAMKPYDLRVVRARRMGYVYPYEITKMLEGQTDTAAPPHEDMARGSFAEYDLDPTRPDKLISVAGRNPGENVSSVVVGVITNYTQKHPEGMRRVLIASDPTQAMGALAEPECRRVIAAMNLAEKDGLPIEWLPISSGAKISMDSGTENLDWTARVLKRIVNFTQKGGEINVIVAGVNVGAQSYWNAEATMLQHTRGVLIMTPKGSMVLTGKKALEYSGSVSAEDERGIGGFERVMGPNGQAQYFAKDLAEAYRLLFEHYRFTYRVKDSGGVPKWETTDPADRSILTETYTPTNGEDFNTIGEIFDDATNPGRKKPFAIREVMKAVVDNDGGYLERFKNMKHADTGVIWDAHLGGHAVTVVGFESKPIPRRGRFPMDGPDTWSGGTLFPQSSKKVARAINAASGNRPVVVLANLSGFDGSPESLRKLQLEQGAEIGRAIVNFDGPVIFVVISRYHGGAYVVFSKALNPNLTAMALEGTYASVIGGAPAAAVVFPREVRARAGADERVQAARKKLKAASPSQQPKLREELDDLVSEVTLEKQGEVAQEFDGIHTVYRATEVGSLDAVIAPDALRPEIIKVLDKAREEAEQNAGDHVRAVS